MGKSIFGLEGRSLGLPKKGEGKFCPADGGQSPRSGGGGGGGAEDLGEGKAKQQRTDGRSGAVATTEQGRVPAFLR